MKEGREEMMMAMRQLKSSNDLIICYSLSVILPNETKDHFVFGK